LYQGQDSIHAIHPDGRTYVQIFPTVSGHLLRTRVIAGAPDWDEQYRKQAQRDLNGTHLGKTLDKLGFKTAPEQFTDFDLVSNQLFVFDLCYEVETTSIKDVVHKVISVSALDLNLYGM